MVAELSKYSFCFPLFSFLFATFFLTESSGRVGSLIAVIIVVGVYLNTGNYHSHDQQAFVVPYKDLFVFKNLETGFFDMFANKTQP